MDVIRVPFNRPEYGLSDIENLERAIRNGCTSGDGPFCQEAENLLDSMHPQATSLLTTSCSHSLEMAAHLLDLAPGDEVIVPSFTFVTTASAFASVGAIPVFADVRDDTLNIDADHVESLITDRTRAICIVHYGGVGATPDRFADLARSRGLTLIEDNAHGLGGTFQGKTLGTFGALSTLSFHETKNITCGEGGALVINQPEYVDRARILRDKGTNRRAFLDGQVDKYTWVDLGSSWVLSDLLAAILVGQLGRLDSIQARRMRLWERYASELHGWAIAEGVRLPFIPPEAVHTAHVFHLRLSDLAVRQHFTAHMASRGIDAVFHYQTLHESPAGLAFGQGSDCPNSSRASETLVRLPLFTAMTVEEQDRVIEAVRDFRV